MKLNEPIELRLKGPQREFQLVASVRNGLINYTLLCSTSSIPHALSNLQSTETFPLKAVDGWQDEVCKAAHRSNYTVHEIR